jgi:hypothetical protein
MAGAILRGTHMRTLAAHALPGLALGLLALSMTTASCKSRSKAPLTHAAAAGASEAAEGASKGGDDARVAQLVAGNEPPTLELPAYTRVGVGQEIGFGLEVVDEESDEIRVELVDKPASATYDPYTLTVVWTPTAKDIPEGNFTVRITEIQRDTQRRRVFTHHFAIAVTREPQPRPVAQPLGPAVETLITIHDPERLAAINDAWPIDRMLGVSAALAYEALPEDDRATVPPPDARTLYESFLIAFAEANHNPRADPRAPEFDAQSYANPRDWKIITVRPRLDKSWNEVRIVYRAKAHEAVYAMFRFKPVASTSNPDARVFNNRAFQRMVMDAFFTEDGRLDPDNVTNKRRHARKVRGFFEEVIGYESDEHPWARRGVEPLPCGSRLGGGSKKDADGNYESGDGWSWHVQLPKLLDGAIRYTNAPIKGFLTDVRPAADNKSYEMACAPRFDPHDPGHAPGFETLCPPDGHVFMPSSGDGYRDEVPGQAPVPARVDAANLFHEHKLEHMVARIALDDPRRDLFEESGMTCHQCHVRRFGVRDMYDPTAYDPSAGLPRFRNKKQGVTYFVIVPTNRWQPYMIDFQHKQECKTKVALATDLGVETDLGCPLMDE